MKRFWIFPIFALASILVLVNGPAHAQTNLSSEIERMQRDITEIQRQLFQAGGAGAGSSGDAVTSAELPANVAGRLQVQLQRLEEDMRRITGRAEELEFQNRQLSQRLEKLATDVEIRFQALEGGAPLAGTSGFANAAQGIAQNSGSQTQGTQNGAVVNPFPTSIVGQNNTVVVDSQGTFNQSDQGEVRADTLPNLQTAEGGELAEGQQLFGQLTESQLEQNSNLPPETNPVAVASEPNSQTDQTEVPQTAPVASAGQIVASAPSTPAVAGGATGLYKHAFGFLKKRDFESAEVALNEFLQTYPDDKLAGNAMYWLGEAHYARTRFSEAADVFVKAYTQYPESSKASHSLLKLGMSLNQLGERDAACQVFAELDSKFPNAEARVVKLSQSESRKLGC